MVLVFIVLPVVIQPAVLFRCVKRLAPSENIMTEPFCIAVGFGMGYEYGVRERGNKAIVHRSCLCRDAPLRLTEQNNASYPRVRMSMLPSPATLSGVRSHR